MSGDDWWSDSQKLEKQISFMEAHRECAVSFHDWRFYSEAEEKFGPKRQGCRVATAVFRGKIIWLPRQFLSVSNEDIYLLNCYRKLGAFLHIQDVDPTVCRIHEANLWGNSDTSSIYQALHKANTSLNFVTAVKCSQINVADLVSLTKSMCQAWPVSRFLIRSKALYLPIVAGFILWPIVLLARKLRGFLYG